MGNAKYDFERAATAELEQRMTAAAAGIYANSVVQRLRQSAQTPSLRDEIIAAFKVGARYQLGRERDGGEGQGGD